MALWSVCVCVSVVVFIRPRLPICGKEIGIRNSRPRLYPEFLSHTRGPPFPHLYLAAPCEIWPDLMVYVHAEVKG